MKADYGMPRNQNGSPVISPITANQRPTTDAQRVGSAAQKPTTAITRPGTASQRPGTASQRPGTASQRPITTIQRRSAGVPPASVSWHNEDDLINTSTHMNKTDSGWGNYIEETSMTSQPQVNISVTGQSGLYNTSRGKYCTWFFRLIL